MSDTPRPSESESSGLWLHYVLAFSAFALLALYLASGKIAKRQMAIEQEFHGIQEMQRRAAGQPTSEADLSAPEQRPMLITLRPLMVVLASLLLVSWCAIFIRKIRRQAARHTPEPPAGS